MHGISRLAEGLLVSQEGLCPIEFEVSYVKCEVFPVPTAKADKGIGGITLPILHLSTT